MLREVSVKLDLLYEIDAPRPWEAGPHPWGQRAREQRAYSEMLDQVKLADELGFNVAWFVEHHFREGRSHCPAPEVVIGALTQVTENIRLGFGVTLLPYGFTHPTRVAEKVATADILSHGRIEWGTGRSTPMEQTAFHVDREASRAEWAEAIEIICAMWREEYFEWHSPTFEFPRRLITPKPYQDPHPPAWMAATSEGSSATAVVLDHATTRQDGRPDPRVPRRVEQPRREADLRRGHQQGRGVHAGALRGDERPGP
jgi:alkanesulfonate monooxygenase SsuD/methylene tetrahydromethanopterin reductase-like flavin-dependent oxidoreductase (luciferase family)